MFTVGLGLLGGDGHHHGLPKHALRRSSSGFGFGGSLLALFMRVGGGIYTKAADVGADLVGKVEAGIPEDDPRNAATIADNVGDNVGDCAGMAADIFESYEVTIVAVDDPRCRRVQLVGAQPGPRPDLPARRPRHRRGRLDRRRLRRQGQAGETNALRPINKGFLVAGSLTLLGTLLVALLYVGNDLANEGWKCFGAVAIGLVLAQLISRLTEYYTGTEHEPVQEIAEASETGPATVVLAGTASGLESSVYAVIAIAIAIGVVAGARRRQPHVLALPRRPHRHGHARHRPASSCPRTRSARCPTTPPASPRCPASSTASRSGSWSASTPSATRPRPSPRASPSARPSSPRSPCSPASSRPPAPSSASSPRTSRTACCVCPEVAINVAEPKVFIGMLIGGAVPFLFSALAIRAVGRTAGVVVQEVRSQFADGQIMAGTKSPDYGPVIDICTAASLRELATPALLAVLTPVIIGFGIGWQALGGFLAAVILVGQLMANYLSNAGGAWDNAKKYIEDGNHGGKGSEAHKAAVIGDTVGDPFKDTAGPALNPLIKVMNLVSLLVLPAIINFEVDDDALRFVVAGVSLVVLAGAVIWSSRKSEGDAGGQPGAHPRAGQHASLMLSGLSEWVTDVIDTLGYVGVALLVALENLFPPIPSEIVLPFAGFVASDGGASAAGHDRRRHDRLARRGVDRSTASPRGSGRERLRPVRRPLRQVVAPAPTTTSTGPSAGSTGGRSSPCSSDGASR